MDIVAEGVETEFEAMMMTKFGCTELQGYYFSRPADADQMEKFLRTFEPKFLQPLDAGAARIAARRHRVAVQRDCLSPRVTEI